MKRRAGSVAVMALAVALLAGCHNGVGDDSDSGPSVEQQQADHDVCVDNVTRATEAQGYDHGRAVEYAERQCGDGQ